MEENKKKVVYVIEEKSETIKKDEKKTTEKVKINKFNKIVLYIFIAYVVLVVLLLLFQFVNSNFSNYMWLNINNKIFDFKFHIMQNFPLLSSYGNIILFVILIILSIISISFYFVFRKDLKKKTLAENILLPIVVVFLMISISNYYYLLSNETHRGINEIYLKDHINTSYKKDDLENIVDYFKSRIITYAESLNRKNGKIVVEKEPLDMAIENLENLAIKYEFLNGNYPSSIRSLNKHDLKVFDNPYGLTYNYTVGIDNESLTNLNKIYVITHELCHVKGISRESDAEYCAFLAGYNSNDDVSKYSMYLNILLNLLAVLRDDKITDNIVNEFGNICLESGYDEICNFYSKDVYRYIKDTNKIELYTYYLDVYKDNKEELKQYLVGLKNRFNVTITTSEDKELTLEEANKLIDEESSDYLYITGNITEKTYNENVKYLNTISNYFPNLFLSNDEEDEEDDENFDYLKPFPISNFATFTEKYPEFSYNRAVRSILEYFDKYIFN